MVTATGQEILRLKAELSREDRNDYDILLRLRDIPITKELLKETQIGKVVAKLRATGSSEEVQDLAKEVVDSWKKVVDVESKVTDSDPRRDRVSMVTESDLSNIHSAELCGEPKRDRVRELLFAALRPKVDEDEREPALVAVMIEEACFLSLKEKDYLSQIRSIKFNLTDPKNADFRRKCLTGFFSNNKFPFLKAEDMASSEWNDKREQLRKNALEECQSDWAMRHGAVATSGMFQCGKCKGTKTTYFQMQTRSSDEPMTTFVTCLSCKNRWKFC